MITHHNKRFKVIWTTVPHILFGFSPKANGGILRDIIMRTKTSLMVTLVGLFLLSLLTACTTVLETGRRQLMLIDPQTEIQLGLTGFREIKATKSLSQNQEQQQRVVRVSRRIVAVTPMQNLNWEFVLFEDKEPNAFALPGGKVGVNSGLFEVVHTDDELAAVIGHEIAHVQARHSGERVSTVLAIQLGGITLNEAMKNRKEKTRILLMAAIGLGSSIGYLLPNSRVMEREADMIGLRYMARAGYNPEAAVHGWRQFKAYKEKRGGLSIPFLSTHPADEERIRNIEADLPEVMPIYLKTRSIQGKKYE